jgi:hypothetical protein
MKKIILIESRKELENTPVYVYALLFSEESFHFFDDAGYEVFSDGQAEEILRRFSLEGTDPGYCVDLKQVIHKIEIEIANPFCGFAYLNQRDLQKMQKQGWELRFKDG